MKKEKDSTLNEVQFSKGLDIEDGVLYGSGNCMDLHIIIPDEVQEVGHMTFSKENMISVSFTKNSNLKRIKNQAFNICPNLRNIFLPEGLEYISPSAFFDCDSLEYNEKDGLLYLGNPSNPYLYFIQNKSCVHAKIEQGSKVVEGVSFRCRYADDENILESVVLPEGIQRVPEAFCDGCKKLQSVYIPNSVTTIGVFAFKDCASLKNIVLPKQLQTIERDCFEGCTNLTYNEKDGLLYLGNDENPYLYLKGSKDTSILEAYVDKRCKFIGDRAFVNCRKLKVIDIPVGVVQIGHEAFKNCNTLESIIIPDGVESIGYEAFCLCNSLTSIIIPASVRRLGYHAFLYCLSAKVYINRKGEYRKWDYDWNKDLLPEQVVYLLKNKD